MKMLIGFLVSGAVIVGLFYVFNNYIYQEKQGNALVNEPMNTPAEITPIEHATGIIEWGKEPDVTRIFFDPTGGADAYIGLIGERGAAIVVVTDIHGDHLSTSTLSAVVGANTILIVPQAVQDLLPPDLAARATVLANGQSTTLDDLTILAIPMYNLPESSDSRHTKGRGNGYVLERDGFRVYVAGDTAGIPEMRALTDIDIALIPMNLPYTMSVEEAASAVLDFKPKQVYPYHYRGQDGLADIEKFKSLVNASDPNIDVVLADWYPAL